MTYTVAYGDAWRILEEGGNDFLKQYPVLAGNKIRLHSLYDFYRVLSTSAKMNLIFRLSDIYFMAHQT